MYFAIFETDDEGEYILEYVSALTFQEARETAAKKYDADVRVKLITDEEYMKFVDEELDHWASLQEVGKKETTPDWEPQSSQPVSHLAPIAHPRTYCVDCGKLLTYKTRPHNRCGECQAKHRTAYNRERMRRARA